MRASKFISTVSRRGLLLLVSGLLVSGSVFSIPASTVFAAAPAPVAPNLTLAQAYKRDQAWLAAQQTNLGKADNLVPAVQDLITKAQAKGIDTTALAAALATFQTQLGTAALSHTSAVNVLAAHNGFDANGNVTDPTAAAQTVHDANQALGVTHTVLVQAMKDLLAAVQAFENANPVLKQVDVLQVAFANEQVWLGAQQNNLNRAGVVVTDVHALIGAAQANHIGATALSNGLAVFTARLGTAQSAHATAAGILSTHNGFDNNGKVTDVTAAAQTVQDARQALLGAHGLLDQSSGALLTVLDLWRVAKHITPASPVYPAFNRAHQALATLHRAVTLEAGARFFVLDTRLTDLLNALLNEI